MDGNNESLVGATHKGMFTEKIQRSLSDTIKWAIVGVIIALFAALSFYLGFSEGGDPVFFGIAGLVLLAIAFMFFSPWRRFNYLMSGVLLLLADFGLLSILESQGTDYAVTIIWTIGLGLGGLSLILQSFNTTLFASIKKVLQAQAVRLLAKIIFWGVLALIGLLVLGGVFSILAGLSATTIIIILLIFIWLK